MNDLIDANRSLLSQALDLLEAIDDGSYGIAGEACFDTTPGGHMRQILEHYGNFLHGLGEGLVDYDRRDRGSPVETCRKTALDLALDLVNGLANVSTESFEDPLLVIPDDGGSPRQSRSNVERELQFLLNHTVHHFALVRTILWIQGQRQFPENFGIAPSTLRYQERIGKQWVGSCWEGVDWVACHPCSPRSTPLGL
ncbi:MAG: hypothetical protein ACP5I4_09135 [Oceanipulchritudo sp.]